MHLHLTARQYTDLRAYLFAPAEPVAFLFTRSADSGHNAHVVEVRTLHHRDYLQRNRRGVEVADHVRPELIRTAHQHEYAVVEAHAHSWPGHTTRFSLTDLEGLHELGPHMTWRLPERPYTALVLGPDSFDALQWHPNGTITTIESLIIGDDARHPTALTLERLTQPAPWRIR